MRFSSALDRCRVEDGGPSWLYTNRKTLNPLLFVFVAFFLVLIIILGLRNFLTKVLEPFLKTVSACSEDKMVKR
jgi:hypothetical protein